MNRRSLLVIAYCAVAIAIFAFRPAPTPGPALRDFEAYWSAGATFNASADPYGRTIWRAERTIAGVNARHDEILPFIDPPATLLDWSLLARIPYRLASVLWLSALAIALLTLVAATLRGSGASIAVFECFAALALAIGFGPITSDLALGQLALLAFAGATLAVAIAGRSIPAGAVASALALAQPNVALGLASQLGRNRATLAIVAGALASYALGVPIAGWSWPLVYARAAAAHGAAEQLVAIQFSPAAISYGFGATPAVARTIAIAFALFAVLAAIVLALRLGERFARFAGWSALIPFTSVFFHEHDLVVAYPAALWCALCTSATTRAIALAGTLLVSIDWLGLAQRPTGIWQSALLALAVCSAFVACGNAPDARRAWRVALPLAALFAGASWLSAHHPAPIWPDALGNFHAPANATLAAVWLAEQRASGLLTPSAVWAFLRSLPLLGCALLAYAIYRRCAYRRTESTRPDSSR